MQITGCADQSWTFLSLSFVATMFLWMSEINAANSQDSFPLSEGGLFGDAFVHLDTLFQTTFKGCWSSVKFIGPKSNHQPDLKNTGYQFPLLTSSSGTDLYWPWGFREKRTITSFDWSAHCYVFVCGFKRIPQRAYLMSSVGTAFFLWNSIQILLFWISWYLRFKLWVLFHFCTPTGII